MKLSLVFALPSGAIWVRVVGALSGVAPIKSILNASGMPPAVDKKYLNNMGDIGMSSHSSHNTHDVTSYNYSYTGIIYTTKLT